MKRGGKFLVSTTLLAVAAGCGQDGKLEIRSTPTPLASIKQPVPQRVAEGRGQLALGNVGLALTSFRIAFRDDPNSTDALVGMAMCYDQMGRYDLSRRNYEAALALAPGDTQILSAFAASLQLQGKTAEAIAVRQEIAARSVAIAALEQEVADVPAPLRGAPDERTVAVPSQVAPLPPVLVTAAPEVELAPRTWKPAPVDLSVPATEKLAVAVPTAERASIELAGEEQALVAPTPPKPQVRTAAVGRSVTMTLPPARPIQQTRAPIPPMPARHFAEAEPHLAMTPASVQPMLVEVSAELADTGLARAADEQVQTPSIADDRGPRIERMSMGEIALITVPRPVWRATTVSLTSRSTTVRFVPLRQAKAQPVKVRLLNAARVNRLAARTRTWLNTKGWRGLAIGNATKTRARSVILYPADKRVLAQRLSAQFGFPIARRSSGSQVVVLLGTDAARRSVLRPGRA